MEGDDIRKVRMTRELMEQICTRDNNGNRLSIEWGKPGDGGFYTPRVTVHYDDNLIDDLIADGKLVRRVPGENE